MSVAARKAVIEARLVLIDAAITATLTRGVKSYSTEIQSLVSLGLDELQRQENSLRSELARLTRGTRFGGIGFKAAT